MVKLTADEALNQAADVFVEDALTNDSQNFRTHTVLVGDDTWEITVRRAEGKTPDQVIHELRAEAERLRMAVKTFVMHMQRVPHGDKCSCIRCGEFRTFVACAREEYQAEQDQEAEDNSLYPGPSK